METFYKNDSLSVNRGKNILAPSKSTAYISNLPFSFTNSDLYKIFSKFGKIVRVTVMRDKVTRKSRGVAFILFGDSDSAWSCVKAVHDSEMFGRTLKANIAKDNGRATEFIRRKEYPDKSRCYECGEGGHMSYACPKNLLGEREPPPKKKRKLKERKDKPKDDVQEEEEEEESENEFEDESLSAAIRYQQELREGEAFLQSQTRSEPKLEDEKLESRRGKKMKKSSYFSDDEEEVSD